MNERNRDRFDQGLKQTIESFERAREWADLSNCLQRVRRHIETYKDMPIPRQRDLAKRLAQCLNPEISVIHQLTLEVYQEVFAREIELMNKSDPDDVNKYNRKSSIALFFSGLFNFYQFASFEVKRTFLELVENLVLKLEKEVILSLPGFMLCMLPALEDQNSEILKSVESILKKTEQIVGTSEFYGEIWKAMLRTPRARLSAIKYLDKRIPVNLKKAIQQKEKMIHISGYTVQIINNEVDLTKDEEKGREEKERLDRMNEHDYFYFFYPNKTHLVINALIAGLSVQEQQVYVNRGTLDFLISHMPINGYINSIKENIRLVEVMSQALLKKDFATLNKIQNWLFEHLEEDGEADIDHKDPTIICIVESQKKLFEQSMVQDFAADNQLQNVNNPILILLRIMGDEQNCIRPILQNLSIHLIKYIMFHRSDSKTNDKFETHLCNLLELIHPYYKAVLESLSAKLQHEIKNLDYQQPQGMKSMDIESIDLISFAIFDMQKIFKKLLETPEVRQYLSQILSNLLKGMPKISNENNNLELIIPSLEVVEKILTTLKSFEDGIMLKNQKNDMNFREGIDSFNTLYVSMSQKLIATDFSNDPIMHNQDEISHYKQEIDTFKKYNRIMWKILLFQNVDSSTKNMPEWLDILLKCSKVQNTKICLVTIELFIKLLYYHDKSNQRRQEGGNPIMHIQRLIAEASPSKSKFTNKFYEKPIKFRDEFLKYLQDSKINDKKGGNSQNQHEVNKLQDDQIRQPHCKEIIQNLWSIIDQEKDIDQVVKHLMSFDKSLVPKIFSDVVIENLQNKETRKQQENAIKKFTIFWKNTAMSYPNYTPFETEVNLKQKERGKKKKYLALHNMINFLEDPDPTLRLSCKSWLSQSSKQYNRIIDPLIEEFIQNSNFRFGEEKSSHGNVYIDGHFEVQYVIENFGKLRNIILNTQDEIIEYICPRNCQKHIAQLYHKNFTLKKNNDGEAEQVDGFNPAQAIAQVNNDGRRNTLTFDEQMKVPQFNRQSSHHGDIGGQNKMNKQPANIPNVKYIDVLVEITLQFIRAEYHNTEYLEQEKVAESMTVNASACEFMELILKQIEKYPDPNVAYEIGHRIIGPLITTFKQCIQKRDQAMQVNIISLLDLILNHCNFQGMNKWKECAEILENKELIEAIILGISSDVSFVRQKFIKFVEMFVPYVRKFTKDYNTFKATFQNQIEMLLECFCALLKKVDISFFSHSVRKGAQHLVRDIKRNATTEDFNRLSTMRPNQRNSFVNVKRNPSDNSQQIDLVINQETDIVLIIGGLQCIVNACLGIKIDNQTNESVDDDLDEAERMRIEKIKQKNAANNAGILGNLFGGDDNTWTATDIFMEIKKKIHENLSTIIVSCIHCWNDLPIFNWSEYHFTRHGMFAYCPEDNKRINESLKVPKNDNEEYLTLEEILNRSQNAIQKKIIELLRPIAKKIPDGFIDGVLHIWLNKSLVGELKCNKNYKKLIQILVCVQQAVVKGENRRNPQIDIIMAPNVVIDSLIKYIREKMKDQINLTRPTKQTSLLSVKHISAETLINSFMYAYLVYNPSMFDMLFGQKNKDKKNEEYNKVYKSMFNYFSLFKNSRNPFTICWLLEMLNILTIKYNINDIKLDNRVKADYFTLLNNLLQNCGQIMSNQFNIKFQEQQGYKLALPPTIYELLWRYEYISFKNTVNDGVVQEKVKKSNLLYVEPKFDGGDFKKRKSRKGQQEQSQCPCPNGSVFFSNDELRFMVSQKFEHIYTRNGGSIFKNMEVLMKEELTQEYQEQSAFMQKIKHALRGKKDETDMLNQTKFFTIITLNQILCQLIQSIIGTAEVEKTNKSISIILRIVIQMLSDQMKMGNNQSSNKQSNQVMNEYITEFFASMVGKVHKIDSNLLKPYKRDVIDLFNGETFFQMNMLNLKQWQKIMRYFIDGKPEEIFEEQMTKWNFQGGLFANSNSIISQKCYAMKRIAFLIFSCNNDDFSNQLDQLMRKMIEVFKQQKKHDLKQRLFLFFLTRVLLIRLSTQPLIDALRKLWPHLLNELISVFEVKHDQNTTPDKGEADLNIDLTIEAIKLVELLSSLSIEDFQMNQWIFLIDGYGMKAMTEEQVNQRKQKVGKMSQLNSKTIKTSKISIGQINAEIDRKKLDDLEVFKTFIIGFIGKKEFSFYNVDKPEDGINQPEFKFDDEQQNEGREQRGNDSVEQENEQGSKTPDANPTSSDGDEPQELNTYIKPVSSTFHISKPNTMFSSQSHKVLNTSIASEILAKKDVHSQLFFNVKRSAAGSGYAKTPKTGQGPASASMPNGGFLDENRLAEQACKLQESINNSNVEGNRFNRQEAEANIEQDFKDLDCIENDRTVGSAQVKNTPN